MEGKICPKCNRLKERKEYSKSTARNDKMAVYCKQCENLKRKEKNDQRKLDAMYNII